MSRVEAAFLGEGRRRLLAGARGRVLEVGIGTGANLPHYPGSAELDIVGIDPDPAKLTRTREKATSLGLAVDLRPGRAYPLPYPDGSFDAVVFALVLCTVPVQAAALAEARRVLRPGGRLLFLEHVRSAEPRLARWQDRVTPVWRLVGGGCHPNRDTRAAIEAAGFEMEWIIDRVEPRMPLPILQPGVLGGAVRRADQQAHRVP
jgi:ubiquinone/menaquinone biosynthesis C-methylase UbiE